MEITVFGEIEVVAEETKNTSLPTKETLPGGLQEDQYNTGSANRDQHRPKSFPFMFMRSCNQRSPSRFLGEAGFRLGLLRVSDGGLAGVGRYQGTPGRTHRRRSKFGNTYLDTTSKAQPMKETFDKLELIKIKNVFSTKDCGKRMKR